MGSESSLWNTVQRNMKQYWMSQRIENLADAGIPDVYFTLRNNGIGGWIELKHSHEWPKRETTPLKIDHFTKHQRSWLRRHGRTGGNIWLLLQVDRDYFLLTWEEALNIGKWQRAIYFDRVSSKRVWRNRINYSEFLEVINRERPQYIGSGDHSTPYI